ncbi:MAG TPA: hypothetical protein VG165_14825 [Solirubrobacteraceae bacterium]|nr:hypothetical protein [Solirubrobacteraceae bacterium]
MTNGRRVRWRTAWSVGLIGVAVAVAVAVAGCGSSSSSTSSSALTPPAGSSAPAGSTGAAGPTAGAGAAPGGSINPPPSSGATGTPSPTSPAKARFIAQADQICAAADAALTAPQVNVNTALKAEQTKGTAAHRDALAAAVRAEAGVAAAEVTQLRRLHAPAAGGTGAGAYVAAVASQVRLIDQLAADVAADDGSALKTIGNTLAAGKTRVDQLAGVYGFKVCGNVPT